MIPTPDLSHLTSVDYNHVYEPAEDTFILLDALEQDIADLKGIQSPVFLEIGSGSGCVSSFIGKILGPSAALFLCTDINPHACQCTSKTGFKNNVPLECINTSFALPFHSRLRHAVDIVVFNPPYVPTVEDEASGAQHGRDIQGSWAGGSDGMQVTEHFLHMVHELLSPRGWFYLVAVKENDVPGLRRRMLELHRLQSDIVLQRRAGREHLFVIRFHRESENV